MEFVTESWGLPAAVNVGWTSVSTAAALVGVGQTVKWGIDTLSIRTPYGRAWQSLNGDALRLRTQVMNGDAIYRAGNLNYTEVAEGQFWSTKNPLLDQDYANNIGAGSFNGDMDFVTGGILKSGEKLITRFAPSVGTNTGGALEIVTPRSAVRLFFFSLIER